VRVQGGLELKETEDEEKEREAEAATFSDLCTVVKDALGDKVEQVVVSSRINGLSLCLGHSAGRLT
jgi:molecular chaperone HtpG